VRISQAVQNRKLLWPQTFSGTFRRLAGYLLTDPCTVLSAADCYAKIVQYATEHGNK